MKLTFRKQGYFAAYTYLCELLMQYLFNADSMVDLHTRELCQLFVKGVQFLNFIQN